MSRLKIENRKLYMFEKEKLRWLRIANIYFTQETILGNHYAQGVTLSLEERIGLVGEACVSFVFHNLTKKEKLTLLKYLKLQVEKE